MSRRKECMIVFLKNTVFLMIVACLPLIVWYAKNIEKNPNIGWLEMIAIIWCSIGIFISAHLQFPKKENKNGKSAY